MQPTGFPAEEALIIVFLKERHLKKQHYPYHLMEAGYV
ncbi:hypothetical protein SAMN05444410_105149 [Hydrobacter penzbergensis]|uniref:Uncharacterized protein n=1 Tax=Hydrobacter penzbergensis TaxID=1235997 RepID=A0A8X8LEQ4_9BACT|nr:hypothetical protein SAMN05444410_105149 [Hydrobacter penzbergensis]